MLRLRCEMATRNLASRQQPSLSLSLRLFRSRSSSGHFHGDGCRLALTLSAITARFGPSDRIARLDTKAAALREAAGTRTVADNITGALTDLFGSVAVAIVALITFRDDLRARLRQTIPTGVPLLTEATAMIASYLTTERELGRIAADADVDTLAPTLIGAGHLLFADTTGTPPDAGAVYNIVTTLVAGVVQEPA
jgi:hypothetical protein